MKSILDPTFRYVPSVQTDIRKTFARIRREQAKADQYSQEELRELERKVVTPLVFNTIRTRKA